MNSRLRYLAAIAAATLAATVSGTGSAGAETTPPTVTLTPVAEVDRPVDLAWRTGDEDALYVVGQPGVITRLVGEQATDVLDISDLTDARGERGLLGMAFSPDGTLAYVNYTDGNGDTNVVEYAVDAEGMFDAGSARPLLHVVQPYGNHNGGDLAFGPDGMLYIGMGDGGAGGDPERRAQNLTELLGKLLRIDPSTPSGELAYTIPADNPYVGTEGARGEIWSIGLRNPWRFSFDPDTGDLWIADVGQGSIEEISFAPATDGTGAGRGLNFGWSAFEGTEPFNDDVEIGPEGHTGPIFQYPHDSGRCSISGGVRSRGEGAGALAGWYVFGDYCTGELFALAVSGEGSGVTVAPEWSPLATTGGEPLSSVNSGPDGAVYALTLSGGVYRVDSA